jgi:hypothetical protein
MTILSALTRALESKKNIVNSEAKKDPRIAEISELLNSVVTEAECAVCKTVTDTVPVGMGGGRVCDVCSASDEYRELTIARFQKLEAWALHEVMTKRIRAIELDIKFKKRRSKIYEDEGVE